MTPVVVGGPGAIVVVRPRGELDMAAEAHLQAALDLARQRSTELVVVDCSAVEFIDSSAIGVFVRAGKKLVAEGRQLQLVNVPASMERVLRIVKLWEYFRAQRADDPLDPLDLHVDLALAWTDDESLRVTFG